MISYIINSNDEAIKLGAFLSHFDRNIPNNRERSIFLIGTSQDKYRSSYDKLSEQLSSRDVRFYKSGYDIKDELIKALESIESDFICFLTTDDIIYQSFDESLIEPLFSDNEMFSFSLRLGKNIKKNSLVSTDNVLKALNDNKQFLAWDWKLHYIDFSAPLSTHGHIFRRREIMKMLRSTNFTSFDHLEEELQRFNNYPKRKMASFPTSKVVTLKPVLDSVMAGHLRSILNKHFDEHGPIEVVIENEPEEVHMDFLAQFLPKNEVSEEQEHENTSNQE